MYSYIVNTKLMETFVRVVFIYWSLCHIYMRNNIRKVGIANEKLSHWLFGGVRWSFVRNKNCGAVNALDAADTDWDYKCKVNKSLKASRVSDFLQQVYQHLIRYSYKHINADFIHIYLHFWRFYAKSLVAFLQIVFFSSGIRF